MSETARSATAPASSRAGRRFEARGSSGRETLPARRRCGCLTRPQGLDFVAIAAAGEITGPLAYRGEVHESGDAYDRNWKKISKNWVSLNTRDHVVAVTLETAWNTPHSTTAGYQQVGRELGLAVERYFRGETRGRMVGE